MRPAPVTVVITHYNLGAFLGETLRSVAAQTRRPAEVLLVDDGSTDSLSLDVLEQIERNPPAGLPLKVIRTRNQKLPAARNTGFAAAGSEFILPLDADDLLDPEYIAKTLPMMEDASSVGFVTTHFRSFGEGIKPYVFRTRRFDLRTVFVINDTCGNSLVRRAAWESVGGYDQDMVLGYEDWEFWIRLGKAGWVGEVVPEPLFHYRRRRGSMYSKSSSAETDKRIMDYMLRKHSDLEPEYLRDPEGWLERYAARRAVARAQRVVEAAA